MVSMSDVRQDRMEKAKVPPREERPPWTFKIGRPVREMATSWRERRWIMTVTRGVGAKARDPRAELMARDFCMASE
jgi:hypothetical protein